MRLKLALLSVLILASGAGRAAEVLRIPERVEVHSDRLVLGDLVAGLTGPLAGISLGYAPYPGHHRWIGRAELEHQILRSGIVEGLNLEMDARVLVTRQSQIVATAQIREAVRSYLESAFPAFEIEIQEVEVPQQVVLPPGSIDIRVANDRHPRSLDGASLKLEFRVEGRIEKTQWARVKGVVTGRVVSLGRDLGYGERIGESDLLVEEMELRELESVISEPGALIGAVAKKPMPAGYRLRASDVRPALLVERGETVTLIARGARFQITTAARAQASGSLGDSIPVENLQSRQVISAVVVAPGTAEVHVPEIGR